MSLLQNFSRNDFWLWKLFHSTWTLDYKQTKHKCMMLDNLMSYYCIFSCCRNDATACWCRVRMWPWICLSMSISQGANFYLGFNALFSASIYLISSFVYRRFHVMFENNHFVFLTCCTERDSRKSAVNLITSNTFRIDTAIASYKTYTGNTISLSNCKAGLAKTDKVGTSCLSFTCSVREMECETWKLQTQRWQLLAETAGFTE